MGKYKFIEERVETMSSSELKIFLNILKSRSKELMSTLESVRGIKDLEAVCKSTQKLNNRVSEFDGGSFLILVVGPVKSGKSTLVNLIAHAHVSPTHFLECTVRPSIISTGIIFFINSWNEYVWPVLILKSKENYTLSLALQMYISAEGGTEFTIAMAVSVLTMLIPLVLYIIFQRYIINTFAASGLKG